MAVVSILQSPEPITPSANGALFLFSATTANQQTMNYVVDITINDVWSHREKLSPESGTGIGLFNVKSAVASRLSNEPVTASTTYAITPAINTVLTYDLDIGVSYSYLTYSAISSSSGSITFSLNAPHAFIVGDSIMIAPSASDPLNAYSGRRQVTNVPSSTSIKIDGTLSVIPSDQTGRITKGDGTPIIISGITPAHNFFLYKAAIDRSEYFDFDQDVVRVGNSISQIGTNMPRTGYSLRTNSRLWLFNPVAVNGLHVRVKTYDQGGTQLGLYQFANPYPVANSFAVYARMGPQDLTDAGTGVTVVSGPTTIINDQVNSYSIQWHNGTTARSDLLTINIDRSQNPPECPVQLLYQDQRGSYVTAVCAPAKRTIKKTDKQTFKKRGFDLSRSSPYIVGDQSSPQHTVFAVDMEESFSTSAVLKNTTDAAFFHELFISSDVYEIQSDGSLLPVVVNEGSRTAVNPYLLKGPIRWAVEYSYAFDQPLNI